MIDGGQGSVKVPGVEYLQISGFDYTTEWRNGPQHTVRDGAFN